MSARQSVRRCFQHALIFLGVALLCMNGGKETEMEGERGRERGGMFHFRLMICTAHGPDHEEEDQPTAAGRTDGRPRPAGLLEGGSVVRRADGDQNQGVHETAAVLPVSRYAPCDTDRTLISSDRPRPPPSRTARLSAIQRAIRIKWRDRSIRRACRIVDLGIDGRCVACPSRARCPLASI